MATLGEILRRFRFHGVPGAPAVFGVPADRAVELEAELEPVFAALDLDQRRAADLAESSAREAARRQTAALEHGRRLVADASAAAGTERAEAAAALLAHSAVERDRLLAAARMEAQRIGRVAAERTPALVNETVRRVLALGEPLP